MTLLEQPAKRYYYDSSQMPTVCYKASPSYYTELPLNNILTTIKCHVLIVTAVIIGIQAWTGLADTETVDC